VLNLHDGNKNNKGKNQTGLSDSNIGNDTPRRLSGALDVPGCDGGSTTQK